MRKLIFVALLLLSSCSDVRCKRNEFYCLRSDEQETAIKHVSDQQLLALADIDQELSHPPSAIPIYELRVRGQERAKASYLRYVSQAPLRATLDNMTRIFSEDWPVCDKWKEEAQELAKPAIAHSCYRVFKKPIDLNDKLR